MDDAVWVEVTVEVTKEQWKYDVRGNSKMTLEVFMGSLYSLETGELLRNLISTAARRYRTAQEK